MTRKLTPEEHKQAVATARIIYAVVFFSFITVCTIAVTTTMAMEKDKPGFQAITVKKPISFFDRTYLHEKKSSTSPEPGEKTP